jgi:hypothetical protein
MGDRDSADEPDRGSAFAGKLTDFVQHRVVSL